MGLVSCGRARAQYVRLGSLCIKMYYVGLPVRVPQEASAAMYIVKYTHVLRDAHRDPNIIHFYAQGTQHNTYHRKPIKKKTQISFY